MGTEKYWQEEKKRIEKNSDTLHPVISQTMKDSKALVQPKHPKAIFQDCLQGATYWKQWAKDEDLTIPEMALIICRDVGCELTYCQATISDPYERPFDSCEQQFKQLNSCIAQEQRRFVQNPEGRNMEEQINYMLQKKRKEKIFNTQLNSEVQTTQTQNVETSTMKDREYIIKESNLPVEISMNNKNL